MATTIYKETAMADVTVVDHPLVQQALGEMRRRETPPQVFRQRVAELSRYLAYEAMRDLPVKTVAIQTPLTAANARVIDESKIILVPILRAGLAMVEGAIATFPHAQVRHLGIYRDEATATPVEYYNKVPDALDPDSLVVILDPMLATGGSGRLAIETFQRRGIKRFKFICVIAAPEGIANVSVVHPALQIFTASIDSHLNDRKFIVPGLGDAGDRCFGT